MATQPKVIVGVENHVLAAAESFESVPGVASVKVLDLHRIELTIDSVDKFCDWAEENT